MHIDAYAGISLTDTKIPAYAGIGNERKTLYFCSMDCLTNILISMEKKDLELKKEALIIIALQKDVQSLKEAAEVRNLKEKLVANILAEQDRTKLTEIESKVREILFPRKPGNVETAGVGQGDE
ncbi:MAG: hypothetical protein LBH58_05845 [Tannerellaceae bacterium]|jgi:hypothetical protein|nr:hypothetical protein [Tannerellaceae bacterium]